MKTNNKSHNQGKNPTLVCVHKILNFQLENPQNIPRIPQIEAYYRPSQKFPSKKGKNCERLGVSLI
jgi:hypothetical protein